MADKKRNGHYSPLVVDLMANADLGGKTVLYMLDALICATSEGTSITAENSKWQQTPFNGDYTSSIFVSQDPVAIDSVGADFLNDEPTVTDNNRSAADITNENYLHEAGLVQNAPSGTVYADGNGHAVSRHYFVWRCKSLPNFFRSDKSGKFFFMSFLTNQMKSDIKFRVLNRNRYTGYGRRGVGERILEKVSGKAGHDGIFH